MTSRTQTLRFPFGAWSIVHRLSSGLRHAMVSILTFCILHSAMSAVSAKWPLAFGDVAFCISSDAAPETAPAEAALDRLATGVNRFVLDNGLIVLTREDASAPVVSIQIWVGAGAVHEQEFLGGGLSHLIEHMIFKGTPNRKPGDISRAINDLGGA
ncbi:MAG: insulinase family protein, partial [Kiritimatiellae bacterium]|nr:insulinase family protein [Kiritimatiellia bacterium]